MLDKQDITQEYSPQVRSLVSFQWNLLCVSFSTSFVKIKNKAKLLDPDSLAVFVFSCMKCFTALHICTAQIMQCCSVKNSRWFVGIFSKQVFVITFKPTIIACISSKLSNLREMRCLFHHFTVKYTPSSTKEHILLSQFPVVPKGKPFNCTQCFQLQEKQCLSDMLTKT